MAREIERKLIPKIQTQRPTGEQATEQLVGNRFESIRARRGSKKEIEQNQSR